MSGHVQPISSSKVVSTVIAIAGTSGAGKSTVVKLLSKALGSVATVFFDDYATSPGTRVPADLNEWIATGADPRSWNRPRMASDLASLRHGEAITHPLSGLLISPTRFIVLEEPFGRSRPEIATHIDVLVYIAVPPEVALARRIQRLSGYIDGDDLKKRVGNLIETYLACDRAAYLQIDKHACQHADLTVDGLQAPEMIGAEILQAIDQKHRVIE